MGNTQSNIEPRSPVVVSQNQKRIQELSHVLTIQAEKKYALSVEDKHIQNKNGMSVLKTLFRQLDPSVMKQISRNVQGEIELSLKFDAYQETLMVKLIRCQGLRARDIRSGPSDPYVKIFLHPDFEEQGSKITQTLQETNHPVFNEIFSFHMTEADLKTCKLVVQVCDKDLYSSDDFLGEKILPLGLVNFQQKPIHTSWFALEAQTDLGITGSIQVRMDYILPDRLVIAVVSASNLSPRDIGNMSDPFVKITIPGTGVIHKTQVNKSTLDPEWNETFEFQVPVEQLSNRVVVFHVIDEDRLDDNDSLGQAIIPLERFNPDNGFHDNIALADLSNTEMLRDSGSRKATAQEFRESFVAHTVMTAPKFLFQQMNGNKMISVSCRKASSQGTTRIINGVPIQ